MAKEMKGDERWDKKKTRTEIMTRENEMRNKEKKRMESK